MFHLKYVQKIPLSLEESWAFFSSPLNLKMLTPSHLGFEITNELENKTMYPGQIISYIIRPFLNLPFEWVTEITHVKDPYYFIDEQRVGPYKFWHHEHHFKIIPGGVEMRDLIYYKMPFGILGKIVHDFKLKQEIESIFSYRHAKLINLFGPYVEPKS